MPSSDKSWLEDCRAAAVALEDARGNLSFSEKDKAHRRGMYPAFSVGLSHGGGQKVCFLRHLLVCFADLLLRDPRGQAFSRTAAQIQKFFRV
jgi:hypothetical protein